MNNMYLPTYVRRSSEGAMNPYRGIGCGCGGQPNMRGPGCVNMGPPATARRGVGEPITLAAIGLVALGVAIGAAFTAIFLKGDDGSDVRAALASAQASAQAEIAAARKAAADELARVEASRDFEAQFTKLLPLDFNGQAVPLTDARDKVEGAIRAAITNPNHDFSDMMHAPDGTLTAYFVAAAADIEAYASHIGQALTLIQKERLANNTHYREWIALHVEQWFVEVRGTHALAVRRAEWWKYTREMWQNNWKLAAAEAGNPNLTFEQYADNRFPDGKLWSAEKLGAVYAEALATGELRGMGRLAKYLVESWQRELGWASRSETAWTSGLLEGLDVGERAVVRAVTEEQAATDSWLNQFKRFFKNSGGTVALLAAAGVAAWLLLRKKNSSPVVVMGK